MGVVCMSGCGRVRVTNIKIAVCMCVLCSLLHSQFIYIYIYFFYRKTVSWWFIQKMKLLEWGTRRRGSKYGKREGRERER